MYMLVRALPLLLAAGATAVALKPQHVVQKDAKATPPCACDAGLNKTSSVAWEYKGLAKLAKEFGMEQDKNGKVWMRTTTPAPPPGHPDWAGEGIDAADALPTQNAKYCSAHARICLGRICLGFKPIRTLI